MEPDPATSSTPITIQNLELKDKGGSLELDPSQGLTIDPIPLPYVSQRNQISLMVRLPSPALNVVFLKSEVPMRDGAGLITVKFQKGENHFELVVIDPKGRTRNYVLGLQTLNDSSPSQDARGYFLVGPVFYTHSIVRSGTASSVIGTANAPASGIRAIFRRRLLKSITDLIPGKPRIFADISGTITKTLSGDRYAQGMPLWGDARATLELAGSEKFRIEVGLGASYFSPMSTESIAGDLDQFFGVLTSARLGYSLSPKILALGGVNFTFPVTAIESGSTLTNQPLEAFFSLGYRVGPSSFVEVRGKYFKLTTTGTVLNAGSFSREETFIGPEVLYSLSF